MISKLPNDVENYILNLVINGINIKNISKVCKNWKKIVMVSDYKKQEKNLYNKTRILMEDKQIFLKDDYFDLAIKWEKFNSHKWDKIYNSIFENNQYQIAGYAKNWRYSGGGQVEVFKTKFLSKNHNKFITANDPGSSEDKKNKSLVQNSKIFIYDSMIEGKILTEGKNISEK